MNFKIFYTKVAFIDLAVLIFGFIDTFYIYIASSYFSEVIGSTNVGFFYFVSYLGSLCLFFFLQPIVRKLGKIRTLYLFLLLSLSLVAVLSNTSPSLFSGGILLLFIISSSVLWVIFDILLETFSDDQRTGSIRGLNLTMLNFGVLLAPLLASITLESYSYHGIFLAMFIFYAILFLFCLVAFRKISSELLPKITFWHGLNMVRREKTLWQSYALSFALYFFYSVMIIYMPLYLTNKGFSWTEVGALFTIMLIPFVLVQYPLGRLADTKFGEKEITVISLLIAIICTLVMGFSESTNFIFWASILFISRIGIAGLEVMKDTYFYRHISAEQVDVISFFRTSLPIANIFVASIATGLLVFLPLNSVFFLVVFVLFGALLVSFQLKDSR